jgi:beta-galactosidase
VLLRHLPASSPNLTSIAMTPTFLSHWRAACALSVLCALCASPMAAPAQPAAPDARAEQSPSVRQRLLIDDGWRFALGHATEPGRDFNHATRYFFFAKAGYGDGPADPKFEDRGWRRVDLPHDWAVELPFSERGSTSHGSKALGRQFPENSVGWYRRELAIPAAAKGKRIGLEFDGVFRDSVVWVNGHYLGREASGYSSAHYDITDYLNYGGRNVVAVRVDASVEEGWWYEGAGIYRHVWLTQTEPLHVDQWGSFVRAEPQPDGSADLRVDITVRNAGASAQQFRLEHVLADPDGQVVGRQFSAPQHVGIDTTAEVSARLRVKAARLWSLQTPQRYTLTTLVHQGQRVVDRYETPFGIRSIRFDPDKGFFLNGQHVKLHGANNHQDHAGVGIALPDALHDYRLQRMKEMGVNAVRSAHHPATPEFLDACDRLGVLVIDEHRMMGTAPQIRDEMERMVRRDRNHPSVILWSVGNEEWAIENTEIGTRLAQQMQAIVRRMDSTRPTTLAASASGGPEGTAVGSQVIGFNYQAQHDIDAMHKRFPDRPMLLTEEGLTHATRGAYADDPAHVQVAAYDRRSGGNSTASLEDSWRFNAARDFLAGMFVWTAFDYRGETTPFGWPAVSSQFGMLDTTGAMKDSAYYLKAAWTSAPMLHILPHWNWAGREGQPIDVRVYGNTDEVELLLNGHSLGRKPLPRNGHLRWDVPYAPGELVARGWRAGQLVTTQTVATSGAPAQPHLQADRSRIQADGRDVAVIDIDLRDSQGRFVPTAQNALQFEVTGPARLIGMGNGDPGSHEADRPADLYRYVAPVGWRHLGTGSREQALALVARADWPAAVDPFEWVPDDQRPTPQPWNAVRGRVSAPALMAGQRLRLMLADVAPGQLVFVDGQPVSPQLEDGLPVLELDAARAGQTLQVAYVFPSPAPGAQALFDAAKTGANWAVLRVATPAAPWTRRAFNGHAQVIVQSSGQPGVITVKARSEGLADGVVQLQAAARP